jgi:predicted SprT family Zn-dependent metalloprotease
MKNKLLPRKYKCKCGKEITEYVWDSEIHDKIITCESCGDNLGFNDIKVDKVGSVTAIRTPTKNR